MRGFLGFDGGGTKTDCVLMDHTGSVLGRGRSGPSNPVRSGIPAAAQSFREAAAQACRAASQPVEIAAIHAGGAGLGGTELASRFREALQREFPGAAISLATDLELALNAAPPGPAMVLVAGTGSAAIARSATNQIARAGGNGPILSDDGSAYDVGRSALRHALTAFDRTGRNTPLGEKLLHQLDARSANAENPWRAVIEQVQKTPEAIFPQLFPLVAAEADAADTDAQHLLREAAASLALLAHALAQRLGLDNGPFALVKIGGMVGRSRFLDAELDAQLKQRLPAVAISQLTAPLAEVAARRAVAQFNAAKSEAAP